MNELWIASYIVLWTVVLGLSAVLVGTLRQVGLLQLRLGPDPRPLLTKEGLERGVEAPAFAATDVLTRRVIQLQAFRGRRVLVVFMTPTCIACRDVAPHLNAISRERAGSLEVMAVCHGSEVTCTEFASAYRLRVPLLLDPTNTVAERYDVRMTPFAFLIDEHGFVRIRGVVNSLQQLEMLLDEQGTVSPLAVPVPSMTGTLDQPFEVPLAMGNDDHEPSVSLTAGGSDI